MKMTVFDGCAFAKKKEAMLQPEVFERLKRGGLKPKIASLVFKEDKASRIYTQVKQEAANRVGIEFQPIWVSLGDEVSSIGEAIQSANIDQSVTSVMIQKPSRKTWQEYFSNLPVTSGLDFADWWLSLTEQIDETKDVDGLHPNTQRAIADNTWQQKKRLLPATVGAVLQILNLAGLKHSDRVAIIGRSDIVGRPLFSILTQRGYDTSLLGIKAFTERCRNSQYLLDFDVVISATGQASLVTGSMVKPGVIAIDVGEPKSDFDFGSVSAKAKFITPVPGGVGPVTIVSLLENSLWLNNHDIGEAAGFLIGG